MSNEFRGLVPHQKVLLTVEGRTSKDVVTFVGTDKPGGFPIILDHHGNMITTEWDKITTAPDPGEIRKPSVIMSAGTQVLRDISNGDIGPDGPLFSSYFFKQIDLEGPAFSHRQKLLQEAIEIITKDRNNSYGEPDQDFTRIAQLWNTYLADKETIESHDVAVMMILLKVSRLSWSPNHKDSWLDVAGYAACGYETEILRRPNE